MVLRAAYFLAQLFYNERAIDSALHYFKEVVAGGRTDSATASSLA